MHSAFPSGWRFRSHPTGDGSERGPTALVSFDATVSAKTMGDWDEVFEQMADELPQLIDRAKIASRIAAD